MPGSQQTNGNKLLIASSRGGAFFKYFFLCFLVRSMKQHCAPWGGRCAREMENTYMPRGELFGFFVEAKQRTNAPTHSAQTPGQLSTFSPPFFSDTRQRTVFYVFLPPTRPRDVIYDVHGQPRSTSETPRRRPSSTSVCSSTTQVRHTTTHTTPARTYTTTQRPLDILHSILRHPQRFLPVLVHFEFLSLSLSELLKL